MKIVFRFKKKVQKFLSQARSDAEMLHLRITKKLKNKNKFFWMRPHDMQKFWNSTKIVAKIYFKLSFFGDVIGRVTFRTKNYF